MKRVQNGNFSILWAISCNTSKLQAKSHKTILHFQTHFQSENPQNLPPLHSTPHHMESVTKISYPIIINRLYELNTNTHRLWVEVGSYSKNKLRYINVNKSYAKTRGSVCKAFLVRPLKYLEKDETIQNVFTNMGYDETVRRIF